MLSPSPATASAVRTRFDPATHGFQFGNTFRNDFVREFDIRTGGLCGGMVYTALDYFNAGRPAPRLSHRPAVQTTLHDYLYDRQVRSLASNLDKWAEIGFNPLGARNAEFFEWGLQGSRGGRIEELCAEIDRGCPVPLGLQSYGGGGPGNHQVLATGYDLGRYRGDLGAYKEDVQIFLYDPNVPNRTLTLVPDVENQAYCIKEKGRAHRWRTYFVDRKYRAHTPPDEAPSPAPASAGTVRELLVEIRTGDDDLRGGNDNLNLTVEVAGRPPQQIPNVNKGRRWIDNYAQTITVPLREPVRPEDIARVVLTTTSRGGMGGDNWNLAGLTVRARGEGVDRTLFSESGTPLFRFTGDHQTFAARTR